jgi:type I restriction enzyme S subunit
MGEWRDTTLGSVVDFKAGWRNSRDATSRGQYPFYTCSQEVLRHDSWDFDGEYVVMAGNNADARFHLHYARGRFAARQRTYIMAPKSGDLDVRFLYYALCQLQPFFSAQAQGTTTKFVTAPILSNAPVSLPPIGEQRQIAAILGALDDKIELDRSTTETLEATAQTLFISWFLDSESDPSDQGGSLADAVDLVREPVDPRREPGTVFQHYSLPAYDAGREATSERGAAIRSSKLAVPRGSILLSKLNPQIERVWLPDIRPDDRAICSTEFLVLRPRDAAGRGFVYEFLKSAPFRSTLTSLVTGTTGSHQRAHAEAILQVPLKLPDPSRAAQFERIVGPMLDRIDVARRESRTLVALRDALLPRLLSGEAPSFGRGS